RFRSREGGRIGRELGLLAGRGAGGADGRDHGDGQGAGEDVALVHECPLWMWILHVDGAIGSTPRYRLLLLALGRSARETDAPWRPARTPIRRRRDAAAPAAAPASPAEAGAHAHRLLVAAEGAADGHRGAVADRALVAQRQRAL